MAFAAGLSEHPLPTQATGEVIGQVLDALGPAAEPPDLALLFATAPHVGAVEDIAAAVRATLNPRTLLGCTAESIVGGGREVEQRPAVALWAGHTGRVTPFHARVAPTPDGNAVVGWPDLATFKTHVRQLKELGLTLSLRIGYRLSPRGEAYLNAVAESVEV